MKKLEIKNSNGEVIHSLKLEDNYTVTVDNGVTVVEEKYVPKVGDCVKLNNTSCKDVFFQVGGFDPDGDLYEYNGIAIILNRVDFERTKTGYDKTDCTSIEKITPEELQAEFNKLGYEYDFDTHTAKKMEWKPKVGDEVWYIENATEIESIIWAEGYAVDSFDFRTKELAEAALETLKSLPHA